MPTLFVKSTHADNLVTLNLASKGSSKLSTPGAQKTKLNSHRKNEI